VKPDHRKRVHSQLGVQDFLPDTLYLNLQGLYHRLNAPELKWSASEEHRSIGIPVCPPHHRQALGRVRDGGCDVLS
jgi:hypothetical protein